MTEFPDSAEFEGDPQVLVEQVVRTLAQAAPEGWTTLSGAISMAGGAEIAQVVATTPAGEYAIPVEYNAIEPIRVHRRVTAASDDPWVRLMFECGSAGNLRVGFDYGNTAPPPDQVLPSEAYLRDLQRYPRRMVRLWLSAAAVNDGRQMRSARDARRNSASNGAGVVADSELPPLPLLWARTAALAAVCRGGGLPGGARTEPVFQGYVGDSGGSVLSRLPGDRAVLSGGRSDSRLLSAAYAGAIAWPDVYRGAPFWVHNLYLDPRAASGLLSFCYWWEHGHWYRAEIPEATAFDADPWRPVEEVTAGVPPVTTAATAAVLVSRIVRQLEAEEPGGAADLSLRFIEAAEAGTVTEQHVGALFAREVPQGFDMAVALAQLDAAGVFAGRV